MTIETWSHNNMGVEIIIVVTQGVFLLYFVGITCGYLLLNSLALFSMKRYLAEHSLDTLPQQYSGLEPPISLLVPAYNEATTIVASVRSLLQLNYAEYEIIVINDGSSDDTIKALIQEFDLVPSTAPFMIRVPTKPVRAMYRSTIFHNLHVIDKENGGKADALNAGINFSRLPLICTIDADSILARNSLQRVVQPFLDDPTTVACGGTVRIANGCEIRGGFLVKTGLPHNLLALVQIVEYLRAFLFGRMGWSKLNAMLIISGAFGLFKKEAVVSVGGYRHDTIGEDMELVVRLHRQLRLEGTPYRITYVPDPICWTEVPNDLRTLKNQRVRWQRGLSESLARHFTLLFHPKAGTVGWLAFPFFVVFEWLGPLIEVTGYVVTIVAFLFDYLSWQTAGIFLLLAIGSGLVLSTSSLLLEELSFHLYPKPRDLLVLYLAVLAENLGYRQVTTIWRLLGLFRWVMGGKGGWGKMVRHASWQSR